MSFLVSHNYFDIFLKSRDRKKIVYFSPFDHEVLSELCNLKVKSFHCFRYSHNLRTGPSQDVLNTRYVR